MCVCVCVCVWDGWPHAHAPSGLRSRREWKAHNTLKMQESLLNSNKTMDNVTTLSCAQTQGNLHTSQESPVQNGEWLNALDSRYVDVSYSL